MPRRKPLNLSGVGFPHRSCGLGSSLHLCSSYLWSSEFPTGFQVQGIPRCFFVSNVCVGYQCMFSANFLVLESESAGDCPARMPRLVRSIVMMPSSLCHTVWCSIGFQCFDMFCLSRFQVQICLVILARVLTRSMRMSHANIRCHKASVTSLMTKYKQPQLLLDAVNCY